MAFKSKYYQPYTNKEGQNLEAKVAQEVKEFKDKNDKFFDEMCIKYKDLNWQDSEVDAMLAAEQGKAIVKHAKEYFDNMYLYFMSFSHFDSNFKKAFLQHYYFSEYRFERLTYYQMLVVVLTRDLGYYNDVNAIIAAIKAECIEMTRLFRQSPDEYFKILEERTPEEMAIVEQRIAFQHMRTDDWKDHESYLVEIGLKDKVKSSFQ